MAKPAKAQKNSNRNVKALVAAASVAASLSGVAIFAATDPSLGTQVQAQPLASVVANVAQQAQPQEQVVTLPPLSVMPMPTLVPKPAGRAVDAGPAAPSAPAQAQAPAPAAVPAAPAAKAAAPAPAAPQLRVVTVPAPVRRAPITTTRSSR